MSGLFARMVSVAEIGLPNDLFKPEEGRCDVALIKYRSSFSMGCGNKKISEEFQMCTFLTPLTAMMLLRPSTRQEKEKNLYKIFKV